MSNNNSKLPTTQKTSNLPTYSNRKPIAASSSSDGTEAKLPRDSTYIVDKTNKSIRENTIVKSDESTKSSNIKRPYISSKGGERPQQSDSKSTAGAQKGNTISLAMLKQQRRNELLKQQSEQSGERTDNNPNDSSVLSNDAADIILTNHKSIDFMLKNARKTGQINLSNYGLTEVPNRIWNLNVEKHEDGNLNRSRNNAVDTSLDNNNDDGECKWWDHVNLTKLILASNKITRIPKDIQLLDSLVNLDIHDNHLESIDEAIGELHNLQTLNLSHNNLRSLPEKITNLRHVINLNVSFNQLSHLPKNIGHLEDLEELNVSNNFLTSIPKSFGWITKLRKLIMSNNPLTIIIPEVFYSANLKIIDLSENQIEKLADEVSELSYLEQLFVRQNKIQKLPRLSKCCRLKDLDFSFNQITEIDENWFDNLVSLVNLNLRDNKINKLPRTVKNLKTIERLDFSNNDLFGLPAELALIESLKQLLVSGNPMRTIRRDIVNRGTDAIIKYLRNHIEEPASSNENSEEALLKSETVKSSKVLDFSCKKLTEITPNMISFCKQSTALVLNLSRNSLSDLPNEMQMLNTQLREFNLSLNFFTTLPLSMMGLVNLCVLDLRGNRLQTIPIEINRLTALRDLILADNKLTEIPDGVYQLPILENLFANNNKITHIDAEKICRMKFISTLNLQNNDLTQIPCELGRAHQIKSLQLEGNPFRIPRPQILAKGTYAIMDYLRSRLED